MLRCRRTPGRADPWAGRRQRCCGGRRIGRDRDHPWYAACRPLAADGGSARGRLGAGPCLRAGAGAAAQRSDRERARPRGPRRAGAGQRQCRGPGDGADARGHQSRCRAHSRFQHESAHERHRAGDPGTGLRLPHRTRPGRRPPDHPRLGRSRARGPGPARTDPGGDDRRGPAADAGRGGGEGVRGADRRDHRGRPRVRPGVRPPCLGAFRPEPALRARGLGPELPRQPALAVPAPRARRAGARAAGCHPAPCGLDRSRGRGADDRGGRGHGLVRTRRRIEPLPAARRRSHGAPLPGAGSDAQQSAAFRPVAGGSRTCCDAATPIRTTCTPRRC